MITHFDAWVSSRLLAGRDVNGELGRVSQSFAGICGLMAGLALGDRKAPWDGFLQGRPDRDEVVKAIADQNPDGPAPDLDGAGDGWPPLRLRDLPPVEAFPIDVLPPAVLQLVIEGAEAIGCPRDFLGLPVLAVAGGTIGRSVALKLKNGYFASSTIFAACIGPPSDGKTPALKIVAAAVRKIDEALETEHARAMEKWKADNAPPASGGAKARPKPPPPPKPRRIDVDDITMEAIPLILADNPRGLVMIRDELSAFLLGMNQFKGGKGNDRSNALKIWSGDAIKKDRVNHENLVPIRCPHPSLSIVGGLTPDMLGVLLDPKGRSDGFIDRFLLVYPDPLPVASWTTKGVSDVSAADWAALIARLWQRSLNVKDGRSVPHAAFLTREAESAWERHYDAHGGEMNAEGFPPSLRGAWGKFREYAGRLILILALMEHASDPTLDVCCVPDVLPRHVDNAWKLIAYFKSHTRRVHAALSLGYSMGGEHVVAAVVDWIRSRSRPSFSVRDIKQARRWIKPDELEDALEFLTSRKAIRQVSVKSPGSQGGRPSSMNYEVNPALLNSQNTQNSQNPAP